MAQPQAQNNASIGQVVGGGFSDIIVRQKAGHELEIGDLLISEEKDKSAYLILNVFALEYGSQIETRMQEMMSGVTLEQVTDEDVNKTPTFYEPDFVNYVLARIKPLVHVSSDGKKVRRPKSMPPFFNKIRLVTGNDLEFLEKEGDRIFVGHIRSGTKVIEQAEVWLPAKEIFTHHVLISATTGRGKSNLVKTMLWYVLYTKNVGVLVLDAHDEYYGRKSKGLKNHQNANEDLKYYTPSEELPPNALGLTINFKSIRPDHFEGIVDFTEPQAREIDRVYNRYSKDWLVNMLKDDNEGEDDDGNESGGGGGGKRSRGIIRKKIMMSLGLRRDLSSRSGVFNAETRGVNTIQAIVTHIEQGKVVILDTSQQGDDAELVISNMVASELLDRYKRYKVEGILSHKAIATIVIEEAPRVIGADVLTSKNSNIYATIAKEGRKFQVGLTAITQLTSVIPRSILANMNTKIILGNEMKQERDAIIASASQDLSSDDRNIASLDRGEAIITSIFVPFAMPIKIKHFDDLVDEDIKKRQAENNGRRTRTRMF